MMNERIFENEQRNNFGQLLGRIVSEPVFSHISYGEKFYEIMLEVKRLSDQADVIPVTFSDRLLQDKNQFALGKDIAVMGSYRSRNQIVDGKSRLLLSFFVRSIVPDDLATDMNVNLIKLRGYVCKPTVFRTTPFNREICDILLAVNRPYNKSDYIPCIAWGRNARFAEKFQIGQHIELQGRIQSRPYTKQSDGQEKKYTAYEVSVQRLDEVEDESKAERYFSDASASRPASDDEAQ